METIILAGGFGKRLQSVVSDIPKPMADINGRPFLSFLLDYLINQKVKKVLLSVCYKHEVIENYFGFKYKDIEIEYILDKEPLGTGGAIMEALKCAKNNDVAVINGDTFFDINLLEMFELHRKKNSILTVAVKQMQNCSRYGAVFIQDNKIISFEEKSFNTAGFINGGIYMLNKAVSVFLNEYSMPFSLEKDFMQQNIQRIKMLPYISDSYFIDIGIPEDYEKAKKEAPFLSRQ
jgi:D-glycero-alpha-D-manno-heptose 1-phosphate guanylyltransferase